MKEAARQERNRQRLEEVFLDLKGPAIAEVEAALAPGNIDTPVVVGSDPTHVQVALGRSSGLGELVRVRDVDFADGLREVR